MARGFDDVTSPRDIDPVGPERCDEGIRIGPPADSAGGIGAVKVALTTTVGQMGVVRAVESLLDLNQRAGFDCPGCAWPEPAEHRSKFEFCENGAKAVAEEATLVRVPPEFFANHSIEELSRESDFWLGRQGRLTHPMYLAKGSTHYREIAWDDAFKIVAAELNAMSSPHEAVFYTSGRTSNEAAFLYQLFVRMLGTNNLPDCSNMCHESSGYAMTQALGSGKGTVSLRDFEFADCIIVIGQNPGTNHPRMLSTLQEAARRGCKIISINPLAEAGLKRFRHPQELSGLLGRGTELATRHLPVKINGDVALLKGIQKAILEDSPHSIDTQFIRDLTQGFDGYVADLARESWQSITDGSAIDEAQIREVARVVANSKSMICCWAMGLTQHRNAIANIQEIVNLLLLGGHFGRPGAGACPVRGHSNVQGDRTVGICERPTREFLAALLREFKFAPPIEHGYATVEAIEAMHAGKVRVFFAMGGNFLAATPDTRYTGTALQRCALTVQVSTKLNRSHLVAGQHALILPCLGRTERDVQSGSPQFVTVEDSMGIVHASQGRLDPASEHLLSEPAIVARLARAALPKNPAVEWEAFERDYSLIRAHIARVIPGFDNFDARVRDGGQFELPHAVRDRREFRTPSGKAIFTVHPIDPLIVATGELIMTTIRSHDQFNTTIYGLDDRYRGIRQGRRVVFMNTRDIADLSLTAGETIDLVSTHHGVTRRARNFRIIPYEIPRGCVATYFPEANVLVPIDSFASGSLCPASKSVIISVARATP